RRGAGAAGTGAALALSGRGAGGESRWRAFPLSRLSMDRPASAAQAGPAFGHRTASAGFRLVEGAVRRRSPDARDRARRLAGARRASAAEGKARPRAGRSALRAGGRVRASRGGLEEGSPALA